jgi:hypothetical protein
MLCVMAGSKLTRVNKKIPDIPVPGQYCIHTLSDPDWTEPEYRWQGLQIFTTTGCKTSPDLEVY